MAGLTREHQRFSTLVPQLMILQQPVSQQLAEGSLKEFKAVLEEFHDVALRFAWTDVEPGHMSKRLDHDISRLRNWTSGDTKRLAVLTSRLRDLNDQLSYLMPEIYLAGSPSILMTQPAALSDPAKMRNTQAPVTPLARGVKISGDDMSAEAKGMD